MRAESRKASDRVMRIERGVRFSRAASSATSPTDPLTRSSRIDEVERVGTGLGHSRVVGDLGLQEGLDGSVGFGVFWRGRRYRNGAGALAMADLVIRDVVFGELIDKRAGKNEIEKLIDRRHHRALRPR